MHLIERFKARLFVEDEVQKLYYLSKELREGRATEVDKGHWDEALKQLEEYLVYEPHFRKTYNKYKERREFLNHTVRVKKLEKYEGTLLIASSLRGLFDTLRVQRVKHEQRGDIIVVMGNWMAFPGDTASIKKAMDLSQEGIIFLRGETEEKFLAEQTKDSNEGYFIETLPTDIRTPHIIVTTGDSKDEPVDMKEFIHSDTPNLTGKTMVVMNPIEGEDSFTDAERKLIVLAPGDATRLELKDI